MHNVLDDALKTEPGVQIQTYIDKLKEYTDDRIPKSGSASLELDLEARLKRKDSIVFGLFCCFCYKNNWTNYVRFAAERRNAEERKEDIDVIESIFPISMDGPYGLRELCGKLKIDIADVTMVEYDRRTLIDFIRSTPLYRPTSEEICCFEPQIKSGEDEEVLQSDSDPEVKIAMEAAVDSSDETPMSPRARRRQKRAEEGAIRGKSHRKRNKPNCLSSRRDDSKRYDWY